MAVRKNPFAGMDTKPVKMVPKKKNPFAGMDTKPVIKQTPKPAPKAAPKNKLVPVKKTMSY